MRRIVKGICSRDDRQVLPTTKIVIGSRISKVTGTKEMIDEEETGETSIEYVVGVEVGEASTNHRTMSILINNLHTMTTVINLIYRLLNHMEIGDILSIMKVQEMMIMIARDEVMIEKWEEEEVMGVKMVVVPCLIGASPMVVVVDIAVLLLMVGVVAEVRARAGQ
mmetsp:Transcript_10061/g.16820  ORF Transcript_10061/g.16820 Transcript_10061/m.16820 type:complete len:166 (+) Transcript_10061:194-691(+)